jgi:hypothetical protein
LCFKSGISVFDSNGGGRDGLGLASTLRTGFWSERFYSRHVHFVCIIRRLWRGLSERSLLHYLRSLLGRIADIDMTGRGGSVFGTSTGLRGVLIRCVEVSFSVQVSIERGGVVKDSVAHTTGEDPLGRVDVGVGVPMGGGC